MGCGAMYQWLDRPRPKVANESKVSGGDAMTSTVARGIQRRVERLLCLNARSLEGRASHEPETGSSGTFDPFHKTETFPGVMTAHRNAKT